MRFHRNCKKHSEEKSEVIPAKIFEEIRGDISDDTTEASFK